MGLQFGGARSRESDTENNHQVELQRDEPFEFLVDIVSAIESPILSLLISHTQDLLLSCFLSGAGSGTLAHASCKVPAAASRRGDSPTLEMMLAAGLELPTAILLPTMRRPQKTSRKPHPRAPWRRCLKRR